MKINLYALRDNKVGTFNPPVKIQNDAAAIRMFGDMVQRDTDSIVGQHPEDFSLWFVGTFDDESGELSQTDLVRSLANGSDFGKEDK